MTDRSLTPEMGEILIMGRKAEQELAHIDALTESGFFSRLEGKLAQDFAMVARAQDDSRLKQTADIYRGACMVVTAIRQMRESHEHLVAQAEDQGRMKV